MSSYGRGSIFERRGVDRRFRDQVRIRQSAESVNTRLAERNILSVSAATRLPVAVCRSTVSIFAYAHELSLPSMPRWRPGAVPVSMLARYGRNGRFLAGKYDVVAIDMVALPQESIDGPLTAQARDLPWIVLLRRPSQS